MDAPRTFFGDPNPPPSTKRMVSSAPPPSFDVGVSQSTAPSSAPVGGETAPSPTPSRQYSYRVSAPDDKGFHDIYRIDSEGNRELEGVVAPGAVDVLNASSKRNKATGAWFDVPEDLVKDLKVQKLGVFDFWSKKYQAGEAMVSAGIKGARWLRGEIDAEELKAQTDPDLLKLQIKDAPWGAWQGAGKAVAGFRWATGEAAQLIPFIPAAMGESASNAALIGGSAMALALSTLGTAGATTPAVVGGITAMMGTGAGYGIAKFTAEVEGGNLAIEMLEAGHDPKRIKQFAPAAGLVSGLLEVVGFRLLTAPMKRAVMDKIVLSPKVQAQLAKWYVNYAKEWAGEVSIEVAQEVVAEATQYFSAIVEQRPDLFKSKEEVLSTLAQVAASAGAGIGIIKIPGAMVDIASARAKTPAAPAPVAAAPVAAAPVAAAQVEGVAQTMPAPEVPTARIIEQDLVQGIPEVAPVLAEMDATLDPNAPGADALYRETGRAMSESPEAGAAVMAKMEALRAEQREIFEAADESGAEMTPPQQERIAAIGNELSLLGEFEQGLAEGPRKAEAPPAPGVKAPATTTKSKVQQAVIKARGAKLESELRNTLELMKELERSRTRLQNAERPTKMLNDKITDLMKRVYEIDAERGRLAQGELTEGPLEVKPSTLESIQKAAFTRGRKEVIKRRASQIQEVAEFYSLSDADVRSLTKTRNLGVMSDLDFKKFIDKFRGEAAQLAERKQALSELHATQEAKDLKHADNLRKFYSLPPVAKMDADQIRVFAGLLESFETGDQFWTPKRMEALKHTRWKGARTLREVTEMASKQLGIQVEELATVRPGELDLMRPEVALAQRNPLYNFMVDEVNGSIIKNEIMRLEVQKKHHELAREAISSRRKVSAIGRNLADFFALKMPELKAYIEAETAEARTAAAALLTKEEIALGDFQRQYLGEALTRLIANKELMSSRFDDKYYYHAKRPIFEALRSIKDVGLKDTLSDFMRRWKLDDSRFQVTDETTGKVLGLTKFMRQTLYRTGEMIPTDNLIWAFDTYVRQYHRKLAMDESVPSVETLTMAVAAMDKSPEGAALSKKVHSFVKKWLNSRKGQAALGFEQGGKMDAMFRGINTLVSLRFIALNIGLQFAAPIGEFSGRLMSVGSRGIVRAKYREFTKQGRMILEKYKGFVGEGVLEELFHPGKPLTENIGLFMYGVFRWARVGTMNALLLANMTEAEFAAGEISHHRLAQIKKEAGRWLDMEGSRSVWGTTSLGGLQTQFKRWAIPPIRTLAEDAGALSRVLRDPKNAKRRMTAQQFAELYRIFELAALVIFTRAALEEIRDRDSLLGQFARYAMREINLLGEAIGSIPGLTLGVWQDVVTKLATNLLLLASVDEAQRKRAQKQIIRQVTPAAVQQFTPKDDKKGMSPTSWK